MCASTCKLVSLNVRGIGNFKKRRTIFTWCRKQKADFIFLQETHSKMDSETCWRNEWGSDIIMAHGTSNSRGVAILVKKDVDCTIHSKVLDPSGQYVIIKAEFNDKMYVLINIYAPNKDSNIVSFFNNLLLILRNNNFDEEENIIMGGDFNCPLNPLMDKKGGHLSPRKSVVWQNFAKSPFSSKSPFFKETPLNAHLEFLFNQRRLFFKSPLSGKWTLSKGPLWTCN